MKMCGWLTLSLALIGAGCNTQASWTYPTDTTPLYRASSNSELTVAVMPFKEARPTANQSGTIFLYLIPLMPFGWAKYERPEAAVMFMTIARYEFQLDEDLGKAATRSIGDSGLFQRAYFTLGGELSEADLVFQGVARSTRYDGTIYSYGLSVFGPLLWIFGLPSASSEVSIDYGFELANRSGDVVWDHEYRGQHSVVQGIYYNNGVDMLALSKLTQKALDSAMASIDAAMPAIEASLNR